MSYNIRLLMSNTVTHDTKRFAFSKPEGFTFEPGQGVELAIDDREWAEFPHPFTPTCVPTDHLLEFIIKRYPGDNSLTEALHALHPGAALLLDDPFGSITYRGPGVFIAAGAGVTPFIAILRHLAAKGELSSHQLIFSNKYHKDLIYGEELRTYLGDKAFFAFTREGHSDLRGRHVDVDMLRQLNCSKEQYFYLCGPDPFVKTLREQLTDWGVPDDRQVYER